jgi:bacillopeptidase F (M6 metalloprotease family)
MNRSGNKLFCLYAVLLLLPGIGRAEAVFWSDNFETNAGNRWTTNGVWRIGSPTAGPATNVAGFRAYSGTNCASTQNYPYSQDKRLICTNYNGNTSLVVPDASQFPRLRFWHWFNYVNALGYVEISTNNGISWTQISPTYENITSGGVWSRPSIDLSAFAGQSMQIAFHFTSGGCCGNAQGWYVDDVAVITDSPVLNNPESFESVTNDWAVDFGTWEIGKPTSGPNAAHTGANCAATVLAGNYANNVDSRLISLPFAVPGSNSPALRFWHWYNFNNALGFVEIRISTNGSSWTPLSPTYLNGNTGGVWTNVSLDLSAYAGQTVQTAFHFTSGGTGIAAGWYVDDISLVMSPTLTVSPVLKIAPGTPPTNGSFQLTFSTGSNTTWRIDASTNLSSWLPLLTNTADSSDTIQFTDLLATNYPWRFYRAVLQ